MTGLVRFDAGAGAGIAQVTLGNPGKLNAMSVAMWRQLREHFESLQALPGDVRVVIVAGAVGETALREFARLQRSTAALRGPHYAYADSAEHREGLAAFNDKRAPRF